MMTSSSRKISIQSNHCFSSSFAAFPSCANPERHTLVPLERHETTHLNCQYHSSTLSETSSSNSKLEFRWSMNSTQEADSVDFPKSQYSTEKNSSVLAFSAKTDMDFGTTITCLATDAVGQTSQPCTFQIVRKGANNDTPTLLKDLLHCDKIWKNAKKIWCSKCM